MRRATRRLSVALGAPLLATGLWVAAGSVRAQDPAGPLCLLTRDEMAGLVGAPIARVDAVEQECAYTVDPAQRAIQVVLGIIPPDPSRSDPGDDPLRTHRLAHPAGGREAVVADRRAWAADDGTWVEVGTDVLVVWLNTHFDADPPPMPDTGIAIATMVVPRHLAAPRASATPLSGIAARFPAAVGDEPLDVKQRSADELFSLLEIADPTAGARLPALRDALAGLGMSEDALEVGQADAWDLRVGYLDIIAIRAPGADMRPLLEPAVRVVAGDRPSAIEGRTIAGREVTFIAPADGDEESSRWLAVDGDVLWMLTGPEPMVQALLESLAAMAAG